MGPGRSARFPPGWWAGALVVVAVVAAGVSAIATAEVWELEATPTLEYDDGAVMPLEDLASYWVGCGRDPSAPSEVTAILMRADGGIDYATGMGRFRYDFAPGDWTCYVRARAMSNGQESPRSNAFQFVVDSVEDPPPPPPPSSRRPARPSLTGRVIR